MDSSGERLDFDHDGGLGVELKSVSKGWKIERNFAGKLVPS